MNSRYFLMLIVLAVILVPCVGAKPNANFTANKTYVCVNEPVQFTDLSTTSTPPITGWHWVMTPSGWDSHVQNPVHAFDTAGDYTVSLTAYDSDGNDVEVKTGYITVVDCSEYVEVFPWCYHQDIMMWNALSDVSGYRVMDHVPERDVQRSITSPAITASSGEQTLGTWLAPAFTETKIIAPGRWIFRTYMVASSDSGTTSVHFRLFNRSSDGTITYLFFGNAISEDVNRGIIPSEYNLYYARRNMTTLFPGDRLGLQMNVSTNSAAARTVTLDVAGNTNASYVSSGYWICDPDLTCCSSSSGSDGGGAAIGAVFGIIGGLIGALIIIGRVKK